MWRMGGMKGCTSRTHGSWAVAPGRRIRGAPSALLAAADAERSPRRKHLSGASPFNLGAESRVAEGVRFVSRPGRLGGVFHVERQPRIRGPLSPMEGLNRSRASAVAMSARGDHSRNARTCSTWNMGSPMAAPRHADSHPRDALNAPKCREGASTQLMKCVACEPRTRSRGADAVVPVGCLRVMVFHVERPPSPIRSSAESSDHWTTCARARRLSSPRATTGIHTAHGCPAWPTNPRPRIRCRAASGVPPHDGVPRGTSGTPERLVRSARWRRSAWRMREPVHTACVEVRASRAASSRKHASPIRDLGRASGGVGQHRVAVPRGTGAARSADAVSRALYGMRSRRKSKDRLVRDRCGATST